MSELYRPELVHPSGSVNQPNTIAYILTSTDPEQVTALDLRVRSVTAYGYKDLDRTLNDNNAYFGLHEDFQGIPITPGLPSAYASEAGHFNLNSIYLQGVIGDGVVLEYEL